MEYNLLGKINSPDDVKKLNEAELNILCEEIRDCIVSTVSKNGGHLASNLGAVELTVALHRAFSSPKDAIIFDVGHQCYTHKLLTGRFDRFSTIRTKDGLSGYMRPIESEHDPFITGHSSNSISAAYGIYKAKKLKGEDGTAIAVVGDGAMTGGMIYEAMNNAGANKGNFIVVLNDNKMSISRNVGALARNLTKLRNNPQYHSFKYDFSRFLMAIPLIGKPLNKVIFSIKEIVKGFIYKKNLFSPLGFNYLGPVDGHNIKALEQLFNIAKGYDRPSLIHVITKKGKGYTYAESSPKNYHGVSPFDIDKGAQEGTKLNFSAVAGNALCSIAEKDRSVCAITAAMTEGTGLSEFSNRFYDRFFDVGIAEQHAVTFASGLASKGLKPFFAVYSSFLQRGFDQLIHDAAIAGLPIKLLIDRAGIVGEDGETHQGLFDAAFLSAIPNMEIYSPAFYTELENDIHILSQKSNPCAVRYPRGAEKNKIKADYSSDFTLFEGNKKAIITYGRIFSDAYKVKEETGISLIKLNKIYPLSEELYKTLAQFDELHFFEEGVKKGGIAEAAAAGLLERDFKGSFKIHAVDNKFVPTASVSEALSRCELDYKAMLKAVKED